MARRSMKLRGLLKNDALHGDAHRRMTYSRLNHVTHTASMTAKGSLSSSSSSVAVPLLDLGLSGRWTDGRVLRVRQMVEMAMKSIEMTAIICREDNNIGIGRMH